MKSMIELRLLDDAGLVFAEAETVTFLNTVAEHGSILHAAKVAGISYMKANKLLRRLEEGLGCPVLKRKSGGVGGGGASLTTRGKAFLESYARYQGHLEKASAIGFMKFTRDLRRLSSGAK